MSLFALGDLHLSFGTDKPMDIFRGWDHYTDRLKENWNRIVDDGDTVVLIGDISWAMGLDKAEKDFAFINGELRGKKIIVKGNHDYWWGTKSKMEAFLDEKHFDNIKILSNNSYLVSGISVCGTRGWINDDSEPFDVKLLNREAGRLDLSLADGKKQGGELVAFIHYPPVFGGEKNSYVLEQLYKYGVRKCYYGHVHGAAVKKALTGEIDGINYHICSCDCVNFSPVLVKK